MKYHELSTNIYKLSFQLNNFHAMRSLYAQLVLVISLIIFHLLSGIQTASGQSCIDYVDPTTLNFEHNPSYTNGVQRIDVYTLYWCDTYFAEPSETWINVLYHDYENGWIYVVPDDNFDEEGRNGYVTIDGINVTINQECGPPSQPGNISGSTTRCTGTTGTYQISSVQGATSYTWSATNGGVIVSGQGTTSIQASFPNTGTTQLSVYAENSCNRGPERNLNVTVSVPSVSFGTVSAVCANATALNLTQGTPSGGTYSGTGITTSPQFSPQIAGAGIHNITYSYTDPGTGCSNTASRSITVNANPSVTAGCNSPVCDSSTLQLTSTESYTYSWSGPSSFTSNVQNPQRTNVNSSMAGTYSVTVTNSFGCSAQSSVLVTVLTYGYLNGTVGRNFILSITALDTITSLPAEADYNKISAVYDYFDGLGRSMEKIAVKASPTRKDIVTYIDYDDFGRQAYNYLPYSDEDGNNIGAFISDARSRTIDFYSSLKSDTNAYARTIFENSSLNRIREQGSAGSAWQPYDETIASSGHTRKFHYQTNESLEVRQWQVSGDTIISSQYYDKGTLYRNSVVDENNDMVIEYTDTEGRVVLKSGINGAVSHNTYYIYDDFGLLRAVLPPKYCATIPSSGTHSIDPHACAGDFAELGYYYAYDKRKRMISKRLPGADSICMVYDKRDRLVLSQDGVMRTGNQWLYTKYDALNRPVISGCYKDNTHLSQTSMQSYLNYKYDNDTTYHYYELRDTSTENHKYTNNRSFPKTADGSDFKVYTVTYYDNYDYLSSFPSSVNTGFDASVDLNGFPQQEKQKVKGLTTGTKVLVLNDSTTAKWIYTVNYYDDKYRMVQSRQTMYPGGSRKISTGYDFIGQVTGTRESQWLGSENDTLFTAYKYDHSGRLLETRMSLNNEDTLLVSAMKYNELGELVEKCLYPADTIQKTDYLYNMRGWLTDINDVDDLETDQDKFAMKLVYQDSLTTLSNVPQYNGNISAMKWARPSVGNDTIRAYVYSYDGLNRITAGDYKISGTEGNPSSFDTHYAYDLNGNLDTLIRKGEDGSMMDNLVYRYAVTGAGGNRLYSVSDAGSVSTGFTDGNTSGYDYSYDQNGNMDEDRNKGIEVKYNFLNLPKNIIANDDSIQYFYDASGVKWLKKATTGSLKQTAYCGSFVYEYNSGYRLDYVLTPEGMIDISGSTSQYLYFLKDHLGNTRTVLDDDGDPIQTSDYYPFGMEFTGMQGGDNKYLYNGKELQDNLLDGKGLDWYDYGARFYDPALGRWHVMDPLAEKYINTTPYHYALNNPVLLIDTDGREVIIHSLSGTKKEAMIEFLNTKTGRAYVQQFLKKGEKIQGLDIDIVGTGQGKYSSSTLEFGAMNLDSRTIGRTYTLFKDGEILLSSEKMFSDGDHRDIAILNKDKSFRIAIGLNSSKERTSGEWAETLGHEIFGHATRSSKTIQGILDQLQSGNYNINDLISILQSESTNAIDDHDGMYKRKDNEEYNKYMNELKKEEEDD
jgi:RHS repeat-associated protein